MIRIHFVDVGFISDETFDFYLNKVTDEIRESVMRYRFKVDRYNALFGKILLKKMMDTFCGHIKFSFDQMKYSAYGKPFITENVHFNISHSSHIVACALSDEGELGIDLERRHHICFNDFKPVMTHDEWEKLQGAVNKVDFFYSLWTTKESVMKADGRGLNIDLKDIYTDTHTAMIKNSQLSNIYHTQQFNLKQDYTLTVASERRMDMGCECREIKLETVVEGK